MSRTFHLLQCVQEADIPGQLIRAGLMSDELFISAVIHLAIPSNNSGGTKQFALNPWLRRTVNSRFSHSSLDSEVGGPVFTMSKTEVLSLSPLQIWTVFLIFLIKYCSVFVLQTALALLTRDFVVAMHKSRLMNYFFFYCIWHCREAASTCSSQKERILTTILC